MPEPLFPFSCYDELLSLAAKTPDERRPRVGPHPALLQPGPPQQGAPWVVRVSAGSTHALDRRGSFRRGSEGVTGQ